MIQAHGNCPRATSFPRAREGDFVIQAGCYPPTETRTRHFALKDPILDESLTWEPGGFGSSTARRPSGMVD